jgi:DNA polymerase III epsilon subunit-like protein
MQAQFPHHLDPNNFTISDFANPYEYFFWYGFYAGKNSTFNIVTDIADTEPLQSNLHKTREEEMQAQHAIGVTGVAYPQRLPLYEEADFCVLDTETSGLTSTDCAIQVALLLFRQDGSLMGLYNKMWKLPAGRRVSSSSTRIHGITNRRLEKEGYDALPELSTVKRMIARMLARGKKVVAHNASFDHRMLRQTAQVHEYEDWPFTADQLFCTMRAGKAFCNLTQSNGRPKAPSNSELYFYFFGELPKGPLHCAKFDCTVTARSYVEGRARSLW